VNCQRSGGWTSLQNACAAGYDSIVSILLAHHDIDVNLGNYYGFTPFFYACLSEHPFFVRELLKDPRLKLDEPKPSPLFWAASRGHLDVIKSWIASGREMDLGKPGDDGKRDIIREAKKKGKTEVVTLLERFKENPKETRYQVRVDLGLVDELAAEILAMVVFVSDGLLQVNDTTRSLAARYFSVARQLPLELQMVLCFRQVGSAKEIIQGKDSEVAFKSLARRLL